MTVRGFETADGRTVEHRRFGGFPVVGDLEAEEQLADVFFGAAAERLFDCAQDASEATGVPYTRIGTTGEKALHAVHEATLPAAFER